MYGWPRYYIIIGLSNLFPRPFHPRRHCSPAFPGFPHSLSATMAPKYHWSDPQGSRTLTKIVKEQIPQWKDGLYPSQHNLIRRVLDGERILCSMATGGGKSAIFAVPLIVLREMARNPHLYQDLPTRALPQGIVVTPTKGLAANIVRFHFPYCTYINIFRCSSSVNSAFQRSRIATKLSQTRV